MSPGGQIAIGVPVRDEAERLPRLLAALAAQVSAPPFTLCLFFDGCRDNSAALAYEFAATAPFALRSAEMPELGVPNAGLARRRAMAIAMENAPAGTLLTTDADGEPASDWIAANLAALERADVVAGRVVRAADPPSARQDRIESYFDRLYRTRRRIDPVLWDGPPTHHWTSGASLALHSETYHALGGFPAIASGEDAALCDAAARAGYRVRRDARVTVRTSARRIGRAPHGFAAALAWMDREDAAPATAHPADETWRFRMQADARRLHGSGDYARLASTLGLDHDEVDRIAGECRNAEAFAARIVGAPPAGMRTVSLAEAEQLLAALEAETA